MKIAYLFSLMSRWSEVQKMGDFVNKSFILDASANNLFNITYRENK
jgi:hypothetical protein